MPQTHLKQHPLIIGLVGPKGSGKGTVAMYLQRRYGATVITGSDLLNGILSTCGVVDTRVNQIKLAEALRSAFGRDAIGRAAAAAAARLPGRARRFIVIDNIRRREDWNPWRENPTAVLVAIMASARRRYERLRRRVKTPEESRLSYARFLKEERLPTETRTILKSSQEARFTIDANCSFADVYRQVDNIARQLGLQPRPGGR